MAISLTLNVNKVKYKKQTIVNDIKTKITNSNLLWIQGPNGSGKSILASIIAGKMFFDKHELDIDCSVELQTQNGRIINAVKHPYEYAQYVSFLPQKLGSSLIAIHHQDDICFGVEGAFPDLPGANISAKDKNAISKIEDICETLNAWVHLTRKLGQCSYGETRKMEFACTCSPHAEIVILDEVFSGLDKNTCALIANAIAKFMKNTNSIWIITSHNSPETYNLKANTIIKLPDRKEQYDKFEFIANTVKSNLNVHYVPKTKQRTLHIQDLEIDRHGAFRSIIEIHSFHSEPGVVTCLTGKNGSGKSTIALVLAGLLNSSRILKRNISGNIIWDYNNDGQLKAPTDKVRLNFQDPHRSYVCPTVDNDIRKPLLCMNVASYDNMLDNGSLNIWGSINRSPYAFSFGQLRFLQLLLIPHTALMTIFDEPLLGLDPRLQPIMLSTIEAVAQTGRNVVVMCGTKELSTMKSFSQKSSIPFSYRKLAEV